MQTVKNVLLMFLVSLLTAGGIALYVKDLIMGDVEKSFSSVYSFQSKIKNEVTSNSADLAESVSDLKSYLDGAVSLNENNIIQTRSDLKDSVAFIGKRADDLAGSVSNLESLLNSGVSTFESKLSEVSGAVLSQDEVINEIRKLLSELPTAVEPATIVPAALPVAPKPPAMPVKNETLKVAESCPSPVSMGRAKNALKQGAVSSRPGKYIIGYSYDIDISGSADNIDIKGSVPTRLKSFVRRYIDLLEWDSGVGYNNCEDTLKVVIN